MMVATTACRPCRVVFRAAAGPRLGFGHLVRSRSLARALGVEPLVSVRGSSATRREAARLGYTVVSGDSDRALSALGPHLVVVDDPSAPRAARWVERARRLSIPVATVHDLGLEPVDSDLTVDGSIEPGAAAHGRAGDLRGPLYAILDPTILAARDRRTRTPGTDVLVALGGGAHVYRFAARLARALAARTRDVRIRVAAGFTARGRLPILANGCWVSAPDGLARALVDSDVAIVAGGVTLYETCALGVPAVAVAVTPAQQIAIRAFARRGAVLDAGAAAEGSRAIARAAQDAERLLSAPQLRDALSASGRQLVDGRGVFRVADALRRLCRTPSGEVSDAA